jgi:signal transduction histidine kinase/CheY-like chemotaxis protein
VSTAARQAWHRRIEARLVLGVVLIVGGSVAGLVVATNRVVTTSALAHAREEHDSAKEVFDQLVQRRAEFAARQSRLITELPVFRAHLSDPMIAADEATVQALAEHYRESLGADFLVVTDAAGAWLGRANWENRDERPTDLVAGIAAALAGTPSNAMLALETAIYQVVFEPARFGDEVLGTLVVGYPLDHAVANELAALTHSEVTLFAGSHPVGSSLEAPRLLELQGAHADATRPREPAGSPELEWYDLGDARHVGREYVLTSSAATPARLVLLRNWTSTQETLDRVTSTLLWIGGFAFVLSVASSILFARPLRTIAEAAGAIAAGDWSKRLPVHGSTEARTMAKALNDVTDHLTRWHSEAAHYERRSRTAEARRQHGEQLSRRMLEEKNRDLVAVNAALTTAKLRAEAASVVKSEFLTNMSHELRTPLNGIIGLTELVLESDISLEQRHRLTTVGSCADGLLTIVNDVLDFSRIETGALELDAVPFNVTEVVEDVLRVATPGAREKGLHLSSQVRPDVPATLVGSRARFRQVLGVLVGNAVKFTPQGAVSIDIAVDDATPEALTLRVEVADTGIGIPTDKLDLIFEPFAQADGSTTRLFGGTGIGLTLSARLVRMMGGRIWVESQPGAGATFRFTVRLGLARSARTTRELGTVSGGSLTDGRSSPAPGSRRILVVVDGVVNQRVAVRLLERVGYDPSVASDLDTAWQQLETGTIDLVLLDVRTPAFVGVNLLDGLRALELTTGRRVPIVALTSSAAECERARGALGVSACVAAPLDRRELYHALRSLDPSMPVAV